MKYKVLKETDKEYDLSIGTGLQGYIDTTYDKLIECFGESLGPSGDNKVSNEWIILITDDKGKEHIATIYDWKKSTLYLGSVGKDPQDIKMWNVGGQSTNVVHMIYNIIKEKS